MNHYLAMYVSMCGIQDTSKQEAQMRVTLNVLRGESVAGVATSEELDLTGLTQKDLEAAVKRVSRELLATARANRKEEQKEK